MATVRSLVAEIQKELLGDVPPSRACELLQQLTSLHGNCTDEVREAEMDYNAVYLRCLESEEKANRAKIRAEATPEYHRARVAKDTHKQVALMMSSLRVIIRAQAEEMRLVR